MMKTTTKGKIAEHRFVSEFLKKGYPVFLPAEEGYPIDLVIFDSGKWKRIQVKYVTPRNGVLAIDNRSTSITGLTKGDWYNGKIDFFAIYDPENDCGYLVPIGMVEGKQILHLRIEPTKNKQKTGVVFAEQYSFF